MKARDIRAALTGHADPAVIHTMCGLAETLSAQQQEITTLAELLDHLTDILLQLGVTIEKTQGAVDVIRKIRGVDSD